MNREFYINNLEINHPFIWNCVSDFIDRHGELYGRVVSESMLLSRLKENLHSIEIEILEPGSEDFRCSYEGFDRNTLYISFSEEALRDPQFRSNMERSVFKELADAAYRIKEPGAFPIERQLFGSYEALTDGSVAVISGTDTLREPFLEYITDSMLPALTETHSIESRKIDTIADHLGICSIMENAWTSDNERFVDLFSAYRAPEAYFTFRDCFRDLKLSGDAAGFDSFFSTYDQDIANDIIRTYAPFWRGKQYRKFLSEGMDEGEFTIRLQKAFEQEANLHPEYREAIFRGENEALIRLVAEEYAYDLSYQRALEHEPIEKEGSALDQEDEKAEDTEEKEDLQELYTEDDVNALLDELEAEAEKEAAKEEARKEAQEKRAALHKQRIEEQRKLTEESYLTGFAIPAYALPSYALEDFNYIQPEYLQHEYVQPEYQQHEYANPEYSKQAYQTPEYVNPEYNPYVYDVSGNEPVKYEKPEYEQHTYSPHNYAKPNYQQYDYEQIKYPKQNDQSLEYPDHNYEGKPSYEQPQYKETPYNVLADSPQGYDRPKYEQQEYMPQSFTEPNYQKYTYETDNYPKQHDNGYVMPEYQQHEYGRVETLEQNYQSTGYPPEHFNMQPYSEQQYSRPKYDDYREKHETSGFNNQMPFVSPIYPEPQAHEYMPIYDLGHESYRKLDYNMTTHDQIPSFTQNEPYISPNRYAPDEVKYSPFEYKVHTPQNTPEKVAESTPFVPFAPYTKPQTINTQNDSAKDSFGSEERAVRRAKEHFETLGENLMSAANRVRYISNATGYTSFIVSTNQMVKNFLDAEIRNSDDAGDALYPINNARRTSYALSGLLVDPFMDMANKNSSLTTFMKADVHRCELIMNTDSKSSLEVRELYGGILADSEKTFKDAISSKKSMHEYLEANGIFDFSDSKLKQEIGELTRLKKSGLLTEAQSTRLTSIQSGISISDINSRIKTLTELKKKGLLSAKELEELEKLICAKEVINSNGNFNSLKKVIGSSFILGTDAARKSSDLGMQGLVNIVDFAENPYTRKTVKASFKFTRAGMRLANKALKGTGSLMLNHTAPGKVLKEVGESAAEEVSKFATKQIKSLADSTIGRFSKKTLDLAGKVFGKIRSPFGGKVSDFLHKGMDIITWPFRKLQQLTNAVKGLIAKIGMIIGGFFITIFLFIIIIDVAGAAFSIIFDETDKNGKVNLAPYIEVLEKKNKTFVKEVADYDPGDRYDHVYTNLAVEDNTKEILSMMAVRFEQDMVEYHTKTEVREKKCDNCVNTRLETRCKGHRDEAFAYIEYLYDISHEVSVSESLPFSCGKTKNCSRRESYTKYVSFSGLSAEDLNDIDTQAYAKIYRDEKGVPLGGDKIYYRCPGDHLNATISSSVLGFDELFYVDNTAGSYGEEGAQPLAKGETIKIPDGLGKLHTYMGWDTVTSKSSKQYKLKTASGEKYDKDGFARIGDRYVIACTNTFGNVGDYVDFYQSDGSVIKGIIGDIKNQNDEGCNKWGHKNGKVIVEFVVDYDTWYKGGKGNHANPGTKTCHPEWNKELTKCVNRGNYWSKDTSSSGSSKTTAAQKKVASYAAKNISTQPTTMNYCAAWVSGVYEAAGLGYPGGNARDFWFKWKSTGSSSPNNIPVGAVVVGSGQGSMGAIYGHVGIYIGNNMVAENIGRHHVTTLDNWIASNRQYNKSLGKKGFVGWVWPGKSLGSGVDGSYGTAGYLGSTIWDDDNIAWAKMIYSQDWSDIYAGYKDIPLDWSDSGLKISTSKQTSMKNVMDDLVGSGYMAGGVGPDNFDCSGLVQYVYEEADLYSFYDRPTSRSLAKMCIPVKKKDAKFGDLVIWSNSKGAYHVAIYCGGGLVFEAVDKESGVRYSKVYNTDDISYYRLPSQ